MTCNISDWQYTYSLNVYLLMSQKYKVLNLYCHLWRNPQSSSININSFIHICAAAKSAGQVLPLSRNEALLCENVRKCESSNFPHANRPSINKLLQNRHFDNIKTFIVGQLQDSYFYIYQHHKYVVKDQL